MVRVPLRAVGMRFLELSLTAFGSFTDHRIDLGGGNGPGGPEASSAGGGLHVIYGPNEAGKSTALRAVSGLLFGIPERSQDVHLHPGPALCVSALIEGNDGQQLFVSRFKKRKDSLRGADGKPLDEGLLKAALGGAEPALFSTLFGLDHQRLKEAGQALLEGHGQIGETLFDAGIGGRGAHNVLSELEREAGEIFRPRAHKSKLNLCVEDYRKAKKLLRENVRPPEKWQEQRDRLEAAQAERCHKEEQRQRLRKEQGRLERIRSSLPVIGKRGQCLERRAELGSLPTLPSDARERRLSAQQTLLAAERDTLRLGREIAHRNAELGELCVPERLLEVDPALVSELRDRVGSHRKAAEDLPKRRGEMRAIGEDLDRIKLRLPPSVHPDRVEQLRLGSPQLVRLRRLSSEHAASSQQLERSRERLLEVNNSLSEERARLEALGAPSEVHAGLEQAVALASPLLREEQRLLDLRREIATKSIALAAELSALALSEAGVSRLPELAAPSLSDIDAHEQALQKLERKRERLLEQTEAAREEQAELAVKRKRLELDGPLPTLDELSALRERRDRGFQHLREAWENELPPDVQDTAFAPGVPLCDAYHQSVEAADELSDRLRSEARRVAERDALLLATEKLEQRIGRREQERAQLSSEQAELDAQWRARWHGLLEQPGAPAEMRAWLRRLGSAQSTALALGDLSRHAEELEQRCRTAREALVFALGAFGLKPRGAVSLDALIELGRERWHSERELLLERRTRQGQLAQLGVRAEQYERELCDLESQQAAWQRAWAEATEVLGLGPDAAPPEVLALLDDLEQLFRKLDELSRLRRRVLGIERDAQQFSAELEAVLRKHAPELLDLPTDEASVQFAERYRRAVEDSKQRDRLLTERAGLSQQLAEAEGNAEQARAELERLKRQAGASDLGQLEELEAKLQTARALERQREELEAQLFELGEGLSLSELLEQARGFDRASAGYRLRDLEAELEQVDEEIRDLDRDIATLERGLEHYQDEAAVDAREQTEILASSVRRHTDRYLRLKLAAHVLRAHLSRYRELNQGPVLAYASRLFPRLTLGEFHGLRVGFEERVLKCLRADGRELGVGELSEGTQYQLYLALRFGTLERYLEHSPSLPLILDDVLIHFDDERAGAAFEILGELSGKLQILYFTHLARDVAIAKSVVPSGRVFFHELSAQKQKGALRRVEELRGGSPV